MTAIRALLLLAFTALPTAAAADLVLLMAEEDGCFWCGRWNAEIAEIYPKTEEGRQAPLQRYDLLEGTPPGITLARRVSFTPTFVLLSDGEEVSRIEGYPGEDFFWGLMGQMLQQANQPPGADLVQNGGQ